MKPRVVYWADGRTVKLGRESRGMSRAELAGHVGCSRATISAIENGRRKPSKDIIAAVACELGYPVSFFERNVIEAIPISVHGPIDFEGEPMFQWHCTWESGSGYGHSRCTAGSTQGFTSKRTAWRAARKHEAKAGHENWTEVTRKDESHEGTRTD